MFLCQIATAPLRGFSSNPKNDHDQNIFFLADSRLTHTHTHTHIHTHIHTYTHIHIHTLVLVFLNTFSVSQLVSQSDSHLFIISKY
jgi:hypothetical protein